MTAVSTIIATAGTLLDSPATVLRSMVIAPLIGPAMAAAVGSVDDELFSRGIRMQVVGMVLEVTALFAKAVDLLNLTPAAFDSTSIQQVCERLNPDFLSLAVVLHRVTSLVDTFVLPYSAAAPKRLLRSYRVAEGEVELQESRSVLLDVELGALTQE